MKKKDTPKQKKLNNENEDPFTDQQPSTLSDPFSGHIFFGAGPIQWLGIYIYIYFF